ncbi:MAG: S8 family serine peptidase [Acidimicrobiales bacterium]
MHRRSTAAFVSLVGAAVIAASAPWLGIAPAGAAPTPTTVVAPTEPTAYLVLFKDRVPESAMNRFGRKYGTYTSLNTRVGLGTIVTTRGDFLAAARADSDVQYAGADRIMGQVAPYSNAPHGRLQSVRDAAKSVERMNAERAATRGHRHGVPGHPVPGPKNTGATEPLASLQHDMAAMNVFEAQAIDQGSKNVRVGIIDTGVDGTHPDIAPNFDNKLSRNFTVDIPDIDGACADDPDGSCTDAANVDEDGHGTHVAGTIGAPINGIGMSGVAPGVDLVNLRAGQDSGYFFVQPVVNALTYAGDNGIDVVNMSFYVDPWLYTCWANPADSPEDQVEQRLIITATNRALAYARRHDVTLVSALGNEHTDMGAPGLDDTSPDYGGDIYDRQIDNATCLDIPAESPGVMSVSAIGPSGRKAYYSNYGTEQTDVSAPGGDYRDFPNTDQYASATNLILAPYPKTVAEALGDIDENGEPTNDFVVKSCKGTVCGYYQYLQGTSMASPHAAGVAALAVSHFGRRDGSGVSLDPAATEFIVKATAVRTACPTPATYVYPLIPADYTATCVGTTAYNGFYGNGVVNAFNVVRRR